jgi:hypothetical protein
MGYWRLNDGQGTIAYDQVANGNNGTLTGGTQWQIATTCFGNVTPQLTYVPDDNFESYLESNGMGNGISDDSVNTASIDTVTFLDVSGQSIYDLTGIEAFTDLTYLNCYTNNLSSSLNLSNNIVIIEEYEKKFSKVVGTSYAISFGAGRMAFFAILKAIGLEKDDEVIIPAFTCVVVPNAIIYCGALPIYVDIDPETFNIDVNKIESAITSLDGNEYLIPGVPIEIPSLTPMVL